MAWPYAWGTLEIQGLYSSWSEAMEISILTSRNWKPIAESSVTKLTMQEPMTLLLEIWFMLSGIRIPDPSCFLVFLFTKKKISSPQASQTVTWSFNIALTLPQRTEADLKSFVSWTPNPNFGCAVCTSIMRTLDSAHIDFVGLRLCLQKRRQNRTLRWEKVLWNIGGKEGSFEGKILLE